MQIVSAHILDIDGHHLPSAIHVFVDSVPMLCGDLIDAEGCIKLQDMSTTIMAISAMEPQFWSLNPSARLGIISMLPRLYAWVILVGEAVARNGYPVRGRRHIALGLIERILWIMRNVGDAGVQFIRDVSLWKDAISFWARARNCSVIEEHRMAKILLHAHDLFDERTVPGFSFSVLSTLREFGFDADRIMSLSLARTHRALLQGAGPQSNALVFEQLFVVRALIDDVTFAPDESPLHNAFLNQKGLQYTLEMMTYCASTSRWDSAGVCISILACFLGQTVSFAAIQFALQAGLIRRLLEISPATHRLSNCPEYAYLLRECIPEFLLSPSVVELADDIKKPNTADCLVLVSSEYFQDWFHLFDLRDYLLNAHKRSERLSGKVFERCGNVRFLRCILAVINTSLVHSQRASPSILMVRVTESVMVAISFITVQLNARTKDGTISDIEKHARRSETLKVRWLSKYYSNSSLNFPFLRLTADGA